MSELVLAAIAVQAVVAAAATIALRRPPRAIGLAVGGSVVAFALATAAVVDAAIRGGDRVGPVLLAFVLGVALLVQAFGRGNLRGDPAAGRFAALAAWLAAASGAAASALDLLAIAAAWTAGTVTVILLLGHAGRWEQARVARRRAAAALLVGDAGLWLAVAAVQLDRGDLGLSALGGVTPATAAIAGTGVALAALSRAASIPFHGWLPASLAAPTPVSALLHAGFVNAGAVLLLRTSDLPSPVAGVIVGACGALTVVVAGAAMLTRPDVKGRLVHSTAAQMGFMLVACAIGAWALALFHVMAHGLFKAASFLGSGTVASAHATGRSPAPATSTGAWRRLGRPAAIVLTALAPVVAAVQTGGLSTASAAMLLFTALAVGVAAAAALGASSAGGGRASLLAVAAAGVGVAYVLVAHAFDVWLRLDAGPGAVTWLLVPALALALGLVALLARGRGALADTAYAFALGWARPPIPARRSDPGLSATVPSEYGSRA
ncbi:proton-conducting transporter membrane subunit [Agromyces aurantiacus]|uniref:Proton-conducting transporter membrane subunit n=1 Tax=Agromyces aurantiacus TaxID=165814 RepID=A0ABV9R5Q0_9MICO|nr:proton-conducting transporter membrane subunit [Agromyces aurantiacus]MBM7503471.1 NADH:ubiquinone oxidoreductase subunit 5 (subunit L)/multisubunit Na+/H+ antiporter MnhA subunit [Agromyces aurantiacus]